MTQKEMASLGGLKGGRSKSPAKIAAIMVNLKRARQMCKRIATTGDGKPKLGRVWSEADRQKAKMVRR